MSSIDDSTLCYLLMISTLFYLLKIAHYPTFCDPRSGQIRFITHHHNQQWRHFGQIWSNSQFHAFYLIIPQIDNVHECFTSHRSKNPFINQINGLSKRLSDIQTNIIHLHFFLHMTKSALFSFPAISTVYTDSLTSSTVVYFKGLNSWN